MHSDSRLVPPVPVLMQPTYRPRAGPPVPDVMPNLLAADSRLTLWATDHRALSRKQDVSMERHPGSTLGSRRKTSTQSFSGTLSARALMALAFSSWEPPPPLISWASAEHPAKTRMHSRATASVTPPRVHPSRLFFFGGGPGQPGCGYPYGWC